MPSTFLRSLISKGFVLILLRFLRSVLFCSRFGRFDGGFFLQCPRFWWSRAWELCETAGEHDRTRKTRVRGVRLTNGGQLHLRGGPAPEQKAPRGIGPAVPINMQKIFYENPCKLGIFLTWARHRTIRKLEYEISLKKFTKLISIERVSYLETAYALPFFKFRSLLHIFPKNRVNIAISHRCWSRSSN